MLPNFPLIGEQLFLCSCDWTAQINPYIEIVIVTSFLVCIKDLECLFRNLTSFSRRCMTTNYPNSLINSFKQYIAVNLMYNKSLLGKYWCNTWYVFLLRCDFNLQLPREKNLDDWSFAGAVEFGNKKAKQWEKSMVAKPCAFPPDALWDI